VDHAVLKMKEQDTDAESTASLPTLGCRGETSAATGWVTVNGANGQRRQQAIERRSDAAHVIDQHGTVGPLAASSADMQRYQWSTLNAGYSSALRPQVRCSVLTLVELHGDA